jgi:hypothetical protein
MEQLIFSKLQNLPDLVIFMHQNTKGFELRFCTLQLDSMIFLKTLKVMAYMCTVSHIVALRRHVVKYLHYHITLGKHHALIQGRK